MLLLKQDCLRSSRAIADWTKVIETYPQSGLDALAYRNRGVDKAWIEDHEGACVDWKEAASLGDEDAAGWVNEFCWDIPLRWS